MKKLIYLFCAVAFMIVTASCEQELVDNSANPCPSNDPTIICPEGLAPKCPDGASAGDANFSKFVAIGTSYTAGFQAGALFNEGQNNSIAKILADQFACVGGGAFNQPNINSVNGFNIFVTPNPAGATVLGRFKLQGTPPQPAPVVSTDALPNPIANPGFMYTGSPGAVLVPQLNNFAVPAIYMGQAFLAETGDWGLAGQDPLFSPFYARFASAPSTSKLILDAASSVANGGTFVLMWLGMDDALLHAAYGGDQEKAPLTDIESFKAQFSGAVDAIFLQANDEAQGVLANFPNPFVMPHFTSVPWNAVPLDAGTAATLTASLANNYNAFLDGMVANQIITAEEAALRKLTFTAGQNGILLNDEALEDLSPYMAGPYEGLLPYAMARQAKSSDIIPLSTAPVLGTILGPNQILGVSVPVGDQYVLTHQEWSDIMTHIDEFNAYIKTVAEDAKYNGRLAFADVNAALNNLVTAQAGIVDGLTITPNINPPTGIYSEDGLHPNSRGYAFLANVFIDAINGRFDAAVPKVNLQNYSATALPINP